MYQLQIEPMTHHHSPMHIKLIALIYIIWNYEHLWFHCNARDQSLHGILHNTWTVGYPVILATGNIGPINWSYRYLLYPQSARWMPPLYEYLSRREFHAVTLHPKFHRINPHNTRSDSFSFNDVAVLVPQGDLVNLDIVEVDEIAKDVDIGHFEQPTPPEVIRSEGHFQTEVINRLVIPYVRRAIKATHPSTATGRGCWVLMETFGQGIVLKGNRMLLL